MKHRLATAALALVQLQLLIQAGKIGQRRHLDNAAGMDSSDEEASPDDEILHLPNEVSEVSRMLAGLADDTKKTASPESSDADDAAADDAILGLVKNRKTTIQTSRQSEPHISEHKATKSGLSSRQKDETAATKPTAVPVDGLVSMASVMNTDNNAPGNASKTSGLEGTIIDSDIRPNDDALNDLADTLILAKRMDDDDLQGPEGYSDSLDDRKDDKESEKKEDENDEKKDSEEKEEEEEDDNKDEKQQNEKNEEENDKKKDSKEKEEKDEKEGKRKENDKDDDEKVKKSEDEHDKKKSNKRKKEKDEKEEKGSKEKEGKNEKEGKRKEDDKEDNKKVKKSEDEHDNNKGGKEKKQKEEKKDEKQHGNAEDETSDKSEDLDNSSSQARDAVTNATNAKDEKGDDSSAEEMGKEEEVGENDVTYSSWQEFLPGCRQRLKTIVAKSEKSYGPPQLEGVLNSECSLDKQFPGVRDEFFDRKAECKAFAHSLAKARADERNGNRTAYDECCKRWWREHNAHLKSEGSGSGGNEKDVATGSRGVCIAVLAVGLIATTRGRPD